MKLTSVLLFYAATLGYFVSFVGYLFFAVFGPPKTNPVLGLVASTTLRSGLDWGLWATRSAWLSVALATGGVVARAIELGNSSTWIRKVFLPATSTYETFTFLAWIIPLVYLLFERRYRIKQVGLFVIGAAFVLLSVAAHPGFAPSDVRPVVPSLDSIWLVIHVLFMLVGIACFTTGFGATVLFLRQHYGQSEPIPQAQLEELMYRCIAIGFVFYFIGGFVFGPIWAENAWGRYWGFDPKEMGMLIASLTYAAYLHLRILRGWRSVGVAWVAALGYVMVLFAWLGVNYFLGGLHSFV
jgi:cytochrome c-type biogenesis protein CcsB